MDKRGKEKLINSLDQNIRNKMILIALVAIIFILSLGIILLVMENSKTDELNSVLTTKRASEHNCSSG